MITRFSRETATKIRGSSSSLLISLYLKMLLTCFSPTNTLESLASTTYDITIGGGGRLTDSAFGVVHSAQDGEIVGWMSGENRVLKKISKL